MKTLHLVSILDRSGSMGGTEVEVIGAYNAFIKDQKKLAKKGGYKAKATLILFDNVYEEVYNSVNVKNVPELTADTYNVRGMTALNDAIGKTIAAFDGKKKVQFFIETDGYENASREYTGETVKKMIADRPQWDFNFVGADLSQAQTANMAKGLGIAATKSMGFAKSSLGYATRNATFAEATATYMDDTN